MEKQYYIVRTEKAGVFFGEVKEHTHDEITMCNVRKIWYWEGACAVEELALNGVNRPASTKMTVEIEEMVIADPIQIIPCTDKATEILKAVNVWKA